MIEQNKTVNETVYCNKIFLFQISDFRFDNLISIEFIISELGWDLEKDLIELRITIRRVWKMKSWSGDEKVIGKVNFQNQSKSQNVGWYFSWNQSWKLKIQLKFKFSNSKLEVLNSGFKFDIYVIFFILIAFRKLRWSIVEIIRLSSI